MGTSRTPSTEAPGVSGHTTPGGVAENGRPRPTGARPPFDTVLVANRGEIALRVIRSCRELGIRTVVAHSAADDDSAAVRAADASVRIGPGPSRRSYLYAPAVIEAALSTGAQAVHPGYGFLSEDPDFAEICADNGLVFVGPRPEVMAELGDKALARRRMAAAGLPVLPGTTEAVRGTDEIVEIASRIGFPLIIKASAGGGGRGMAVVRAADDLVPTYRATRAAARSTFGDDSVYVERYWDRARHVEVQVLADTHGTVLHLGERDCSVQRRHQKLVEESPAPGLSADLRSRLCEYAVRGARAVGYTGAGTFEFLVQGEEIAFIEMNCRIQVEHPVTEMVTGVDIVREQLMVAAGHPVSLSQREIVPRGVAVECRVNAEDPDLDFAPRPGLVSEFVPPGGPFVRVDTAAYPGWRVPTEYDSLLAKVVVWGPDRAQALSRMDRALDEFRVAGPGLRTTVGVLRRVLAEPTFRAGTHTTALLAGGVDRLPVVEPG
ncbi:pyruvate carboxylase subunit A [Actinoalloteichus sp. AHMU CJ021]|uniref:biotin carboxylase n=1 Tax=Actinoalloteichus caeruleus DSM 43889 TaxID=1120930 RepID=A0ABT1JGC9_ACTCY|nr:acetyl-CoA carboxylase biotin carboxylase subunit [Actinoalloteichus caeruleus]AUS77400.1 pyruvate carboxylase subunit A [Actinoalloteichus sp. AHMU CJ021]MCP2331228.1 acetyl-CoA carboxylase, biotin carboxylase subunit [Actinoalloteichus caeruleus DSM 43889]